MTTQAFTQVEVTGEVETTNAAPTSVPGLAFALADKELDTFEVEVWVVRSNATTPSVGYIRKIFGARNDPSGAYKSYVPTAGTNPVVLASILSDAGLDLTALYAANQVTFQVTGVVSTTYEWHVKVKRTTWSSGP